MARMPTSQDLTERIRIDRVLGGPFNAVTRASANVQFFSWAWALVTQFAGGEIPFESQTERSQRSNYEIWIRHIEGFTATMQIVWKGRTLVQTANPQLAKDANSRQWWVIAAQDTVEN